MQDYIELAKKNGITLLDTGKCQFCHAETKRGIHECLEIFSLGLVGIDFNKEENQIYRFYLVDAHVLQHSEIHGRWNNHLHLSRLHLIFKYNVQWYYHLTSQLSDCLNKYKANKKDEFLYPPEIGNRGRITSVDIIKSYSLGLDVRPLLMQWAKEVYDIWEDSHDLVNSVATRFLNMKK